MDSLSNWKNYELFLLFAVISVLSWPLNADPVLRVPDTEPHNRLGRICGLAIIDVLPTILLGVLISWLTGISLRNAILGAFITGIVTHWLFEINTPLNVLLLGN